MIYFRIEDPFGNKKTFFINFEKNTSGAFSGWGKSGTALATKNLFDERCLKQTYGDRYRNLGVMLSKAIEEEVKDIIKKKRGRAQKLYELLFCSMGYTLTFDIEL